MIYLVLVFTLLHVVFYGYLTFGWSKIKTSTKSNEILKFSIIVPVRNEEGTVQRVLGCLSAQEYPKDHYEVIVINDFSEDSTLDQLEECIDKLPMNLRVVSLTNPKESGKKHALTRGVNEAKFEYIITTDADCQMGPHWIDAYSKEMVHNQFVAGPVAIKGRGLFGRLQQIEFSGLIGFGAVTIEHNNPSMCSGANLGFTKKAFLKVGGYTNNINIPSGDDEFLLYNILKKFPGKAAFLKTKPAIVLTPAQQSITKFINQRTRWTSKWKHNMNWKLRVMAMLFFMDYLIFYAMLIGMVMMNFPFFLGVSIFLVRLLIDYIYLNPISRFLGNKNSLLSVFVLQLIYPLHVLFMGVSSIFGSYTWKGRKY